MGIFDRLSTMLRSNINDLISRAENPEKMLNQLILDMKSSLAKAKQEAAAAIADEKKLQADAEELQQEFSGDDLMAQFKQLEYKGSSDQQLLDLKAKMGLLPAGAKEPAKQLGRGEQAAETVHEPELEEDREPGPKP